MARFQADPKETHYATVKRIVRYLKGAPNYGLWYDRSNDITLCTYTDVDQEGSVDARKSTSGKTFLLGGRLVSLVCKKQEFIL